MGERLTPYEHDIVILKYLYNTEVSSVCETLGISFYKYHKFLESAYKKIINYWDLNKETLNFWGETTHYHRPLTWYSKLLKKYGFVIEELKENPDDLENFKPTKEHQRRVPLFMCFSCLKKEN